MPLAVPTGLVARLVMTDRSHGDLSVSGDPVLLDQRRRQVVDAPWSWLHQVHGAAVHRVTAPGDKAGSTGDALCTTVVGAPLAVQVADCAPVALIDESGVIAVAHAGWRGVVAGVLEQTVASMRQLGAQTPVAVLGPCIRSASYAFGEADLATIVDRLGSTVRARTATGETALDLAAAVTAALGECGVDVLVDLGGCTAADIDVRWSHRARRDPERQALVLWLESQ